MVCGNGASARLVFAMWCLVSGNGECWGQKERKTTDEAVDDETGGGGGGGGGRGVAGLQT